MLTPVALEIGFALLSTQGGEHLFKGPSDATAMDLRYDFFLGDLWISVDGVELDARWGWVPLLDAAACFSLIADELAGGKNISAFDFTESGDEILFDCDHQSGRVCISSNFAEPRLYTTLADLREAVRSFGERVIEQAVEREPSLKDNKTLEQRYPTYTQRRPG